jgi:prepilin-type N-terminal cleavage/methylation domain-containing protein/prepilin-type processing-associated H-X9-DG protein
MSQARLQKGFTLIELLVVIAIIAILAAILFPVFAPAGGLYQENHMGWDEACQPYIKNKTLLWCPDAASPGNDYTNTGKSDSDWTGSLSYATNCRLAGKYGPTAKLSILSYPAQTILLSENGDQGSEGACRIETDEWGWTGTQTNSLIAQPQNFPQYKPGPLVRHKGGANYAFADGHAKWLNGHSMGLQGDGTSNDTEVSALLNDSGNVPTYHLSQGN